MNSWQEVLKLTRQIPCAHCGAERFRNCSTRSGRRATIPHAARIDPLWQAFNDGVDYGMHFQGATR